MSKENKLVPKLRFPEFQQIWKKTTLKHKVFYENGKAHENDVDILGKFVIVNSKFISSNGTVKKFTNSGFCLADKGDILMVLSDVPNGKAIAKCFYVEDDNTYTVNQRVCKLKPKQTIGLLLYYIINRNSYFLSFDDGIKQTNLKNDDVLNFPIVIPKEKLEQQKIADCLSSLDDLITGEKEKLDALKKHKKGLMQQLFPVEGEKVPKLRFPEFKNGGEWEEKTFSQLFEIGNGRDYKQLSYGDIPVYGSGGLMLSVDQYLYDGDSVCIGRKGTIDRPMFLTGKFWTVDTLFYTHSFKYCLPKFIFYIFQKINWYKYNEAGGVPSLSKTTINKIETLTPKLKEQQKIADCLSSLDTQISIQSKKIDELKTHKKGLMQQLFPTIN